MPRKKQTKIVLPSWMGPLNDIIPNEVMFDTFRLNVWIGTFLATFAMLHNMDKAAAESAAAKDKDGGSWSFAGTLDTIGKVVSPGYTLARSWVPGFDPLGTGEDVTDKILAATSVDWDELKLNAENNGNDLYALIYGLMGDQFIRNALLASSVASLTVYVTFEKDAVSAALAASGEIMKGIGEIVPG